MIARIVVIMLFALSAIAAQAKPVCVDGMCYPSEEAALEAGVKLPEESPARLAMGYMAADKFIAFLKNEPVKESPLSDHSLPVILLLVLLGGLAANLTPCVLPLVPVNLAIIMKGADKGGWARGAAYGIGITVSYGTLGILAAFGSMAFGQLQSSPYFSAFTAIAFLLLALASLDLFTLPSLPRIFPNRKPKDKRGLFGVFLLGCGAAAVAGACVEPILLATLLLTADWFAAGRTWAVVLPFILGAGMALPWPFAAAGLSVLPKPGKWMVYVKRGFALILFAMSCHYAFLAFRTFTTSKSAQPAQAIQASHSSKPVLYIIGAPWCKNCSAMERDVLNRVEVMETMKSFEVRRLEINDFSELAANPELSGVPIKGLPAYVIKN